MATFDEWTLEDARATVAEHQPADAEVNKLFFQGDHFQDGDGWIGPKPAETDDEAETVWEEIEAGFVSKNAIAEVIDRHANAVIGREPSWSLSPRRALAEDEQPSAEEQSLIAEAEAALTEWWDSKKQILLELQTALRSALWGERVCLRLYVPRGLTQDADGEIRVPRGDLAESLNRIFLEVVEFDRGAIERDPDTQEEVGVYVFADKDNLGLLPDEPQDFAELHYLDADQRAIIRLVGGTQDAQTTLDLSGQIAFHQIRLTPFITEQVRSQNKLLNMACTMMARNVVLGGFLERVILNAQLPGQWIDDPDNPGRKKFQPEAFRVGAGSTNALAGIPIYGDPSRPGQVTGYTSPNVVYRDPVNPTSFITTKAEAYSDILDETRQRHVLIARDATASGESRRQAMADFIQSLDATVTAMNTAGRWLVETALAMAANFSGEAERFKLLRAIFECKINPGPIPSDEQQQVINLRSGGLISRETAMTRVGVDDPAAEAARIAAEATAAAEQQAELFKILPQPTGGEEQ
jgi:hypothetical protein